MQEVQILGNKVDLLLKKYTALQAENARLQEKITEQLQTISALNKKITKLEENMAGVHTDKAIMTTEDKEGMRRQLDVVIGEIDKILTTLND